MAGRLSRLGSAALPPLAVFLAALLAAGCGKGDGNGAQAALPGTGELAVTARLEEIPGAFPANDLYDYVFVMKYRVLKVLRGSYDDSIILVGHYNPRMARSEIQGAMDSLVDGNLSSFNTGDAHQLVLTGMESAWTQAIEDNYFRDMRKRYFSRWVSR
jgi:hypothetical protein